MIYDSIKMLENPYATRLFRFCPYYYSSKRCLAQEFSYSCYVLFQVFEHVFQCVVRCTHFHTAKFQDHKQLLVLSESFLFKKIGPGSSMTIATATIINTGESTIMSQSDSTIKQLFGKRFVHIFQSLQ